MQKEKVQNSSLSFLGIDISKDKIDVCLLIDDKNSQNMWVEGYVKWEIGLLSSIGFSLNLNECAVTGKKNNLYFVSPKTGKSSI